MRPFQEFSLQLHAMKNLLADKKVVLTFYFILAGRARRV
jgi:hypothetical protein